MKRAEITREFPAHCQTYAEPERTPMTAPDITIPPKVLTTTLNRIRATLASVEKEKSE